MQRIGKLIGTIPQLREIKQRDGKHICLACNTEIEFTAGQWRKSCSKCGNVISIPKSSVIPEKDGVIKCFICMGKGLLLYKAQDDGQLIEYVARCRCPAGASRKENGIPFIDEVKNAPNYFNLG